MWIFVGLCIYVYIGYPALIWIISKFYKRPIDQADIIPSVSLIIAAYNEDLVIRQKIQNSLKLDYPPDKLDMIIVADGSDDSTADIASEYENQGIRVLHDPIRRGKSAALNRGVAAAENEILIFSDANAFYHENSIKNLVRNFNDPNVGCVSGRKTIVQDANSAIGQPEGFYWKYESFIKKKESLINSSVAVVGEINAIRKSLYDPIPENIIIDDAYLALRTLRQGYRVIYEPEAFSWETSSASTHDEIIRRRRNNAGQCQLFFAPREIWCWNAPFALFQVISHKFLRLWLPIFMIGAFVMNLIVLLLGGGIIYWFMMLGQIAFYLLAFIGYLSEKAGYKLKIPSIAYYVTSANFALLSGLQGYFSGQQTVLWEKAQRNQSPTQ